MRDLIKSFLLTFIIFVGIIPAVVLSQVRESSNFKIERDSLNVSGGLGSSGSYQIDSTVGEIGSGSSESGSFSLNAGYQQTLEETFISISSPTDVSMASINGVTGGFSTSSAAWTVTTNNSSGYTLGIKSSTNPAMKSALDQFNDYVPVGSNPDFDFTIDTTTAEFGFSPSGTDIISRFQDNGSACNLGSSDAIYNCWDGFTTSNTTIAQSASSNSPTGTITTVNFRAESGSDKILTAGDYSATITVTAVAL